MADRVKFGGNQKKELEFFLHFELNRVESERESMEDNWERWIKTYRAPMPKTVKEWPYEGASDLTFPVTSMSVDPIKAKYMASLHATNNLWALKPLNERWVDAAKPMQDYLMWLDVNILRMHDTNSRVINEMLKLGTGIYKTGWEFSQRPSRAYDQNLVGRKIVRTINRPVVDHVTLNNFFIPPEAQSVDADEQNGALWVAERRQLRASELRQMSKSQEPFLPQYDPKATEKVLRHLEATVPDLDRVKGEVEDLSVDSIGLSLRMPITIFECHVRFDADNDGFDEDIVVTFHAPSQTILRAIYNPFAHGKRPYQDIKYLRGDGFYGIGIGERSEPWQEYISDLVNFNTDKVLLSNSPMWAIKEGANVLPNEPIFPGKIWPLADPANDIKPLFMVAPGSFDIQSLVAFANESSQRSIGVSDLNQGSIGSLPSRTPATTVQSLLQESNTRLDMSIKDARLGGLSQVGLQVLQNVQQQVSNAQNNPGGRDYLQLAIMALGEPEGSFVAQQLAIPFESIETGLGVELTATSGTNNQELQKQNLLALLQLFGQWGPQLVQLAQIAAGSAGSPIGNTAAELFSGARELILRVLEQFDIRDPEKIAPGDISQLIQAQGALAGQGQQGAVPAGGGGQGAQGFQGFGGQ